MTWGALRGTGITWDAFHGRIKHSSVLASHKLLATVLRSRRVFFFVFRYANPCHLGYGLHSRCGHGRGIRECVCTRRDVLLVPTDRGGSLDSIASLYCHSCAPTRVDPADGIRTTLTTERLGATRTAALVVRGGWKGRPRMSGKLSTPMTGHLPLLPSAMAVRWRGRLRWHTQTVARVCCGLAPSLSCRSKGALASMIWIAHASFSPVCIHRCAGSRCHELSLTARGITTSVVLLSWHKWLQRQRFEVHSIFQWLITVIFMRRWGFAWFQGGTPTQPLRMCYVLSATWYERSCVVRVICHFSILSVDW
jgi:hypothetical protein